MKTIHHFSHPLFQLWSLLEILCADEVVRLPPFLFSVQKALYDSLNSLNSLLVFIIALLLFLTPPPPSAWKKKRFSHFIFLSFFSQPTSPPSPHTYTSIYLFLFSLEHFICSNLLKSLLIFSPPTPISVLLSPSLPLLFLLISLYLSRSL